MAEKILNTRIQLRYDNLADWQSSTAILKKGEAAIAYDDNNNIIIKIGDGSKTFANLPGLSGAVIASLQNQIGGLSGAMHFKGVLEAVPEGEEVENYNDGDVIIVGHKEYVCNEGAFVELGDDSILGQAVSDIAAIINGTKTVGKATSATTADNATNFGNQPPAHYATAASVTDITKANGTIDTKIDAAIDELNLGTMAQKSAADYVLKSEAPGYGDILTKTAAASTYMAKANNEVRLSTAINGADTNENSGLSVVVEGDSYEDRTVHINFDDSITFVFDCGNAVGEPLNQ